MAKDSRTSAEIRQEIYNMMLRAANDGKPCPTTVELATKLGRAESNVQHHIRAMHADESITFSLEKGRRVVTINGKRTAAPNPVRYLNAPPASDPSMISEDEFSRRMGAKGYRFEDAMVTREKRVTIHATQDRTYGGVARYAV